MGTLGFNPNNCSTYLDCNIYKMNLTPIQWDNIPDSLSRYNFFEAQELRFWPSNDYPSQLESAMQAMSLQFMIAGALKTMRTNSNNRVIVFDIPTPDVLPEVKLYVSENNNWHYDLVEPYSAENFEIANKLGYVYFQDKFYFVAMRPSLDKNDIFLFVYKK